MFHPAHGFLLLVYIIGALIFSGIVFALCQLVPQRMRKYVIWTVTFLGGLYYALEFFLPAHPQPTKQDPTAQGNFLTPTIDAVSNVLLVVSTFTIGLGIINLCQVHGKRLAKGGADAINSFAFFFSMIVMTCIGLLQHAHPNAINKNLYDLLFTGALATLDATMFSLIAFYIVSAAYRAFRVRSVEASILLITALIVMLGQIAMGQFLTHGFPSQGGWSVFRVEVVRSWILTVANTAAVRAIAFGLGIGGLAVALRIWLGLERGSYFEGQS